MTENTIIPMVFYDILDQTTVFGKMYMLAMHVLSLTTCTCNKYDSWFFFFFLYIYWDIDVRIKNNIYKCNWALVTYAQLSNALVYMHVFVIYTVDTRCVSMLILYTRQRGWGRQCPVRDRQEHRHTGVGGDRGHLLQTQCPHRPTQTTTEHPPTHWWEVHT